MPEVKLSIGGKLDIVSPQEMKDEISNAITGLQGHIDKRMTRDCYQPIRRPVTGSGGVVVPFGGAAKVLIIGTDNANKAPSLGKLWVVRSMFVFDNTNPLTASQAGINGALCIGDAAGPVPTDMGGWTFTGLPAANTFNSTSLVVEPNQSLYAVLNVASAQPGVCFTAQVDEWDSYAFQAQRV